jgi:hypothetical protein
VVGDGHAMRVATEIMHDILGAAEGTFQLHHPVVSIEGPEPSGENLGLCEKLEVSVEVELAVVKGLLESIDEFATKEFSEHFLGQKVVVSGTHPAGVIGRETAGGHYTMDMRMSGELLAQRM